MTGTSSGWQTFIKYHDINPICVPCWHRHTRNHANDHTNSQIDNVLQAFQKMNNQHMFFCSNTLPNKGILLIVHEHLHGVDNPLVHAYVQIIRMNIRLRFGCGPRNLQSVNCKMTLICSQANPPATSNRRQPSGCYLRQDTASLRSFEENMKMILIRAVHWLITANTTTVSHGKVHLHKVCRPKWPNGWPKRVDGFPLEWSTKMNGCFVNNKGNHHISYEKCGSYRTPITNHWVNLKLTNHTSRRVSNYLYIHGYSLDWLASSDDVCHLEGLPHWPAQAKGGHQSQWYMAHLVTNLLPKTCFSHVFQGWS